MNNWRKINSDPIEDVKAAIEAAEKQQGYRPSFEYWNMIKSYAANNAIHLKEFITKVIGD